MLFVYVFLIAIAAALSSATVLHFLARKHLLVASAAKGVHLTCAFCGLLVARFDQTAEGLVRCVNCKRAAEK